jgi:hypothetical protein
MRRFSWPLRGNASRRQESFSLSEVRGTSSTAVLNVHPVHLHPWDDSGIESTDEGQVYSVVDLDLERQEEQQPQVNAATGPGVDEKKGQEEKSPKDSSLVRKMTCPCPSLH